MSGSHPLWQHSTPIRREGTFSTVQGKKKLRSLKDFREQLVTAAVTLTAAIVAGMFGAPDKWLAAIFATVVTFGGMITFFRERWSSGRFWMIIASAMLIHLVLVWFIFGVALRQRNDVGLPACLPVVLLECFILYHAVRLLGNEGQRSR